MTRAHSGYLFKCKRCGRIHLLDKGMPHDEICVHCIKSVYDVSKYNKKDFTFWCGDYAAVFDICVKEIKNK